MWSAKGARSSSALCVSVRSCGGSKSSCGLSRSGGHYADPMTWKPGKYHAMLGDASSMESHMVLFLGQFSLLWPPCLHPVFMGSERPWREQDAADSEPVDGHCRHAEGAWRRLRHL